MSKKIKENLTLIGELKKLLLSGKKIDEKTLQDIGVDTTIKSQDFRNIRITNDFWNSLKISIIDNEKDLDGIPISENKKLILRAKNLFENGTKKIKISELLDLNIWSPSKEIILGNILLKDYSDFLYSFDYYKIEIIDKKKNIDNLWTDNSISSDRILEVLHKYDLITSQFKTMKELDLNKELELHFKKFFETVKKGGRSNQGDIDLIIGSNHNYGIELKLAKELSKASASQKAIGQIEQYTKQFKENFMLIVAGLPSEKNEKAVAEVVKKAKNCEATTYYLEAH